MNNIHLPHDHGEDAHHALEHMPPASDFFNLSDTFKQLSDPSRLRIFWLLCHCEECVINISAAVSMSSPAVSHHLKLLKSSNLIVSRRVGKEVYYTASDTEDARLLHGMMKKLLCLSCSDSCHFE